MSTLATLVWREYMNESCDLSDYPSSILSGIVGDLAHRRDGGYHISIEDQSAGNYSVVRVDDKAPPGGWARNAASAGDKTMSRADMVREWNRYLVVWQNRATDPRAKYINAYNGYNGVGDAERLDFVAGTRGYATRDHKDHSHREGRRRYANDPQLKRALLSIERGETVSQYLGVQVLAIAKETDEMKLVHKMANGDASYAVVTPGGWSEVAPGAEEQKNANALASLLENSKEIPADRYDTAKVWWLTNVVPLNKGTVTQAQLDSMAEKVAAAVIASDTNELTQSDLNNVKASVKQALREGTAQ